MACYLLQVNLFTVLKHIFQLVLSVILWLIGVVRNLLLDLVCDVVRLGRFRYFDDGLLGLLYLLGLHYLW